MLYIQVDTTLIDHPKTKKLARLLGVSRITAVGHLVALWSWAAQYALDGDLTQYRNEPDVLADGAEWEAEPEMFVSALIAAKAGNGHGFLEETIDGRLLLHDWDDYYGKLIERRRADAERKRAERAQTSSAEGEYVRRTSNGHPTDSERKSSVNVAYSSVTQRNESERSEAQRNAETDAAERAAALTPGPVVARASTTRTTVKPNSKVSKQVNLFAAVTGFFPVRQLHHIIDNAIAEDADQPFLKQCFETWLSRGYRKENLAWLTEWYASGSIPPAQRGPNGKGAPLDPLKAYTVDDLPAHLRAVVKS